jgi:hypothetical protein
MKENLDDNLINFIRKLEHITENEVEQPNDSRDIKDILFAIITSSKFRRSALNEDSKNDIKKKINNTVDANLPIEFSVPFGCYKSYLLPSYPEADWAEVFNLRFMINYLLPVSKIYKPGVILSYSKSQLVNKINNVPLDFYDSYVKSLDLLIKYFQKQCPSNLSIRIQEINDLYDTEKEWQDEYNAYYEKNKNNWNTLYDQDTRYKRFESAKHNFIIKGERDLSNLNEEELNKEYLNAAMLVDVIENFSKRRIFNKLSHRIQVVFLKGPSKSIHLGSCESSTVQFWVGFGVVEINGEKILPRILSFNQMTIQKDKIQNFTTDNAFCSISPNFKTLPYFIKD